MNIIASQRERSHAALPHVADAGGATDAAQTPLLSTSRTGATLNAEVTSSFQDEEGNEAIVLGYN